MLKFSKVLNMGLILKQRVIYLSKCVTESNLQHLFYITFVHAEVIFNFSSENLRWLNF